MSAEPTRPRKEPRLGRPPVDEPAAPPRKRPDSAKPDAVLRTEARPAGQDAPGSDADAVPKSEAMTGAEKAAKPVPPPASRLPQIRLLPVTIFVAVLMLSVKVNDIWRGISVTSQSRAQQAGAPANRPNQTPPAAPAPGQQQSQAGAAQPAAAPSGARPAASPPAATPASRPTPPLVTTPSPDGSEATFTQTEIDVLQKLAARRSELEGRSKELDGREALLKAAESRIDKKITEMKTLQGTIEGLLRQYNDQEDTKMKSLVKIYENMKPKDAAKIFEQLDMPIMLDVIERMKEAKVAPIMAEMDPSKAKSLTSELAHRRQIPVPKSQ